MALGIKVDHVSEPGKRVATKERRCPGCRSWYALYEHWDCPNCGEPGPVYSPVMYKAKLDGHLFRQAEACERQDKMEKAAFQEMKRTGGYDIGPLRA